MNTSSLSAAMRRRFMIIFIIARFAATRKGKRENFFEVGLAKPDLQKRALRAVMLLLLSPLSAY
jgi:hypothetical protein